MFGHPCCRPHAILYTTFLCFTDSWTRTRSAVLRKELSGLCGGWRCCKYNSAREAEVGEPGCREGPGPGSWHQGLGAAQEAVLSALFNLSPRTEGHVLWGRAGSGGTQTWPAHDEVQGEWLCLQGVSNTRGFLPMPKPHAFFQASRSLHPASPLAPTPLSYPTWIWWCSCLCIVVPAQGWLFSVAPVAPWSVGGRGWTIHPRSSRVDHEQQCPGEPSPHAASCRADAERLWSPPCRTLNNNNISTIPVSSFNHMPKLRTL